MDETLMLAVRTFLVVVGDHIPDTSRAARRAIEDVDALLADVALGDLDPTAAAVQIQQRIEVLMR